MSPRDPAHEVLELQRRHAARSRERVLSDNELQLFWQATANMAPAYRDALRLVLLTGQRPGEVIGIRAEEVDSVKAVWRIPAARVKNKRDHMVPLTGEALHLLRRLVEGQQSGLLIRTPRGC